jgi:NitT/TauT family transport system substrate-binding protein
MRGAARWAMAVASLLLVSCSGSSAGGSAPAASGTRPAAVAPTSGAGAAPASVAPGAGSTAPGPASTALEPARFVVTAIAMSISAAAVAQELGYFAEEGIDAELVYVAGAAQPAQALVAGEVQFVGGAGATAVPATLEGADLVVIANHIATYPFTIQSVNYQRLEDLRGTRLGITRRGAASEFAAKYALRRAGLEADQDVILVQMGGEPEALAGLESGAADAAVLSEFGTVQARARGYRELVDVSKLGADYALTGLVTTRKVVAERPDFVRRFVRGWVRGVAASVVNPQASLPIITRFIKAEDSPQVHDAYALYTSVVQRVPYPRAAGIQAVLDTLAPTNPRATTARPDEFMDDRFIRELDQAGFFQQLYGE